MRFECKLFMLKCVWGWEWQVQTNAYETPVAAAKGQVESIPLLSLCWSTFAVRLQVTYPSKVSKHGICYCFSKLHSADFGDLTIKSSAVNWLTHHVLIKSLSTVHMNKIHCKFSI